MSLLKHINKTTMLLPYEQLYIQTYHHKQPISEQSTVERNSIYQLIHDTFHTSLPTRPTDQYPPATEQNQLHPDPARKLSTNLLCKQRIILRRAFGK
jgi:hypothetical protein